MLYITRKPNQAVLIGKDIRVVFIGYERGQAKFGVLAPKDIPIWREELSRLKSKNDELREGPGPA